MLTIVNTYLYVVDTGIVLLFEKVIVLLFYKI